MPGWRRRRLHEGPPGIYIKSMRNNVLHTFLPNSRELQPHLLWLIKKKHIRTVSPQLSHTQATQSKIGFAKGSKIGYFFFAGFLPAAFPLALALAFGTGSASSSSSLFPSPSSSCSSSSSFTRLARFLVAALAPAALFASGAGLTFLQKGHLKHNGRQPGPCDDLVHQDISLAKLTKVGTELALLSP